MQPCVHLLGKKVTLGSPVSDILLCFVPFPFGVLVQMWFLIVSIPNLCLLFLFFVKFKRLGMSVQLKGDNASLVGCTVHYIQYGYLEILEWPISNLQSLV